MLIQRFCRFVANAVIGKPLRLGSKLLRLAVDKRRFVVHGVVFLPLSLDGDRGEVGEAGGGVRLLKSASRLLGE